MIMNESGIHTICLKRKYSYSKIQNIIEQSKCFCCGKDRYELSSYYQITQYKSRGVEIQRRHPKFCVNLCEGVK